MRLPVRLLAVAPAAALALTACATTPVERSISAAMVEGRAGFRPSAVTVEKGDKVDLEVSNSTDREHGFSIEGHGVEETIRPNAPRHVRFTAREKGTFRIFCQLHPMHQPARLVVK